MVPKAADAAYQKFLDANPDKLSDVTKTKWMKEGETLATKFNTLVQKHDIGTVLLFDAFNDNFQYFILKNYDYHNLLLIYLTYPHHFLLDLFDVDFHILMESLKRGLSIRDEFCKVTQWIHMLYRGKA